MKSFSNILESRNKEEGLLKDEMDRYIKAMNPKLPKRVQACLYVLNKYPQISTKEDVLAIRDGQLRLFDRAGVLPEDLKDLQKMLRALGNDIKLLPHFLNEHQRQALEQNRLSTEDITLDITTKAGREKTAKQYMPLIMKIARQLENKCSLSFEDLVSAGAEGLTKAMNSYKTSEEMEVDGKKGTQTFGQYAAWQIRYAMMNEISSSSAVGQSYYMKQKNGSAEVSSIDATYGNDEDGDPIKIDRLIDLSELQPDPDYEDFDKKRKDIDRAFLKKLESKFSARDCDIFCRYMGICAYDDKSQEGKAIARSYMISGAAVSQKITAMVKWIKSDKESLRILRQLLQRDVTEGLAKVFDAGKEVIIETLLSNDRYILLESLDRWPSKSKYQDAVDKATNPLSVDDALFIFDCLRTEKGFLEKNYKKYKPAIIAFLNNLYPAESFRRADDDEIIERMNELIDYSKEYKIRW